MGVIERAVRVVKHTRDNLRPNMTRSEVESPQLVNRSARIVDSRLRGQIDVRERALIRQATLEGHGGILVGRHTSIVGPTTGIWCSLNPVTIGDFCSIGRMVSIQEYNHCYEKCTTYYIFKNLFDDPVPEEKTSKGPITIGHDVWIGMHSSILSGTKIGNGAVIGAHSVVTGTVPPYAVALGCPARVMKYRFPPDIVERLLKLEWWAWSEDRIRRNQFLFEGRLTSSKLDRVVE